MNNFTVNGTAVIGNKIWAVSYNGHQLYGDSLQFVNQVSEDLEI